MTLYHNQAYILHCGQRRRRARALKLLFIHADHTHGPTAFYIIKQRYESVIGNEKCKTPLIQSAYSNQDPLSPDPNCQWVLVRTGTY